MYVYVYLAYMYISAPVCAMTEKVRGGHRISLELELQRLFGELNPVPLQEQAVLLTAESSL